MSTKEKGYLVNTKGYLAHKIGIASELRIDSDSVEEDCVHIHF